MSSQQYEIRSIPLTEAQKHKLARDVKKGCKSSVRITKKDINAEGEQLALSPAEGRKLDKARAQNKGIQLDLSLKTLKYNLKQEGAFLPMLAGLAAKDLPMIAKIVLPSLGVGTLSGLAST